MNNARRSQAERRKITYQQVLDSACRLFGERGYESTSLEEIATACGLTTRPIYHYFGNKKALFFAVNEVQEQRIISSIEESTDIMASWRAFLKLCDDPGFRRIVLLDSPNILGRDRWMNNGVVAASRQTLFQQKNSEMSETEQYHQALIGRVLIAAFAECALMIAEAKDIELAKQQADKVVAALLQAFVR